MVNETEMDVKPHKDSSSPSRNVWFGHLYIKWARDFPQSPSVVCKCFYIWELKEASTKLLEKPRQVTLPPNPETSGVSWVVVFFTNFLSS